MGASTEQAFPSLVEPRRECSSLEMRGQDNRILCNPDPEARDPEAQPRAQAGSHPSPACGLLLSPDFLVFHESPRLPGFLPMQLGGQDFKPAPAADVSKHTPSSTKGDHCVSYVYIPLTWCGFN